MYSCLRCDKMFVQQNGLNYHKLICEKKNNSDIATTGFNNVTAENSTVTVVSSTTSTAAMHTHFYEFCDSCCKFLKRTRNAKSHITNAHATNNVDLSINKDQLLQVKKWFISIM